MLRFAIVGAAEAARNSPAHPHRFDPQVDVGCARWCRGRVGIW